jgi:crotonobetainyl-CoA:carnitine CoA-transferase CaiB-like acyl-CoA transferase
MTSELKHGPLEGCRVIELGSTVAGPFCGRLLADFGAEVIKVEPPSGDPVRTMGKRSKGRSLYAASILRNKHLISVDLRTPSGQAVIKRLVAESDILVENFRPGKLEEWGMGYESLSEINPGIIVVRISGYGQTGPYKERPGYGVTSEAVGGLREVTGDADRPPTRVGISLTDSITGLYGAFGAVMAMYSRERTGKGQVVDAALYEGAFSFMEPHVPAFAALGAVATRTGSRLPDNTPNNLYPTGDGQFIHITAGNQATFIRLAACMGMPELVEDARYAAPTDRSTHEDELDAAIGDWTAEHSLAELEQLLEAGEVPAARIYTMKDIFDDVHYQSRDMLLQLPDDTLGSVTVTGVVPKLSHTPGTVNWAGREVGVNTREVLKRVAGYREEEVETLVESRAVYAGE